MCTNVYSFEYLLDYFIADRLPSKATIKHYKFVVGLFVKDTNITDVREITKLSVNQWRNNVFSRASASTCNNYIRHLKSLFNCALEDELIETNPFAKVKLITDHKKLDRTTNTNNVAEAIAFLREEEQDYMPGWFWVSVILTLYYTGMRRKQLVSLCWRDIDFNRRIIQLRAESSKNKREWEIPLNVNILNELIALKKFTWDLLGREEENIDDQQVFNITLFNSRYSGEKMTEAQVSGFFRNLSEKLGFKLSTHRFRHRLASELVNKKEDVKLVQNLLGHTNILTTYGYVTPDMGKIRALVSEIQPIKKKNLDNWA
ncbi:MAG: site-specific integrase [Gammaproteobacteria bacterium]|nr:site-specific integrase [Gammaproteobacteria bacterium]